MRLSLPTVLGLLAIVGAGAFAAGQATAPHLAPAPPSSPAPAAPSAAMPMGIAESDEPLPPGHPPTTGPAMGTGALPPGHPSVDSMDPNGGAMALPDPGAAAEPAKIEWKAPSRWQSVPNASSMRLATYRVPRAPGDSEDAELTITQAGGSVEANAVRWIGQFDAEGQKTAKRSTRKVGALDVTRVEATGNYSPDMGTEPKSTAGRALLGAIIATPGMPHFFKLTGPAKSVLAARAELDALIASVVVVAR